MLHTDDHRLLTEKDFSSNLAISLATIRNWRTERRGPPLIKIGNLVQQDGDHNRRSRQRRLAARVPGRVLCRLSGISRTRLSDLERGYVEPEPEELARLDHALSRLEHARERMRSVGEAIGWPKEASS